MNIQKLILSLVLLSGLAPLHAADPKTEPPAEYPLKTCVVSDEKLGEHGKAVKVNNDGTDVYLCCKMCRKDFEKNPVKYTTMVKEAMARQAKSSPGKN